MSRRPLEFEIALPELEAALPGPAPGELAPEPGVRTHPFRALHHREFALLFSASSIGDIGYWISFVALQAYMADITDKSATWLGILFFANFIPMLLFAPVAGVVADRMDRKRLLVLIRVAIAGIGTLMAALILADVATPVIVVMVAFALGTTYGFLGPTQSAAVANTVPQADLLSAVSMSSAGNNFCRIAGPALGAPILAIWGAGWSFAVYAASSALVAALLLPIRLSSHLDIHSEHSAWSRMKDGLRHARERPPAVAALVTMSVFSIFGAAQIALYPLFANDVHHRPTEDFTAIVVASGVGAVIGAVGNAMRKTVPPLRTSLRWLVGFALASLGFALAPSWATALGCAVVVGFCYFSMTTALNTLLQHLADDDKRGRIMSLFVVTWGGLIPVGAIWMGTVADHTSAPFVVALGAIVCLVFALGQLAWIALRPGQPSTAPLR
ncbi:MAG: MFS transporter [Acidimicrobiia bacterium]|jgi:MFS family permease